MPESVNYWTPIPSPAGQLFHADLQRSFFGWRPNWRAGPCSRYAAGSLPREIHSHPRLHVLNGLAGDGTSMKA
jgi:hypothetical protein